MLLSDREWTWNMRGFAMVFFGLTAVFAGVLLVNLVPTALIPDWLGWPILVGVAAGLLASVVGLGITFVMAFRMHRRVKQQEAAAG